MKLYFQWPRMLLIVLMVNSAQAYVAEKYTRMLDVVTQREGGQKKSGKTNKLKEILKHCIAKDDLKLDTKKNITISSKSLTTIQTGAFSGLTVNTLKICKNPKLTTIQSGAFKRLTLQTLYISDNHALKTISTDDIINIKGLQTVYISQQLVTDKLKNALSSKKVTLFPMTKLINK